ncbi:Protein YffB [Wohlfahrtiimonas chitiniclastica SH04]|uniref:Protein YffB n=1 Tax=Wohlfahrtiimonas chitiniclastica SH04 TaxID=1261130 RepID=L8XY77_9GAMM|nr:Spx/MgsR family RNA polymerase-binding regulatory protein [Wohlfahrtiimonas chitiniclastica]ELV07710.1 Protein YffB [Wohlfahrtiimonas chitiniclastica SH04]MBS7814372.1 Spx/MgsR family RNA polymerase-binding regulatory protein [Wohlfahrtiimonas chitiniclastica]
MFIIYGIPNCDTVKKARAWLTEQNIEYTFSDFKKSAPSAELLKTWIDAFGLDVVINKRGTTWRKLSTEDQAACAAVKTALPILLANLSMIKRPILMKDDQPIFIGFDPSLWQAKLK